MRVFSKVKMKRSSISLDSFSLTLPNILDDQGNRARITAEEEITEQRKYNTGELDLEDAKVMPYRMKIRAPGFAHLAAMDEFLSAGRPRAGRRRR